MDEPEGLGLPEDFEVNCVVGFGASISTSKRRAISEFGWHPSLDYLLGTQPGMPLQALVASYRNFPCTTKFMGIPPTRARSPKLGRHKPSNTAANNSSEDNDSTQFPESELNSVKQYGAAATALDGAAPKKTATQKSISKPTSLKSATTRPETKATASKIKASNIKKKMEKGKAEERENEEEHEIKPVEESPVDAAAEVEEVS
ncbi:hypothetical protein MA16_Dca001674 [Dendrobium catenatum]|uniref:Uncharacterized protein n=1 Tax=Dendrobium catenatum TaxID=906689 RepID=A0A2I0WN38_9ASPA|nr:hypothetical protein MA16_Dca001674 [Dendrobium catenatum]